MSHLCRTGKYKRDLKKVEDHVSGVHGIHTPRKHLDTQMLVAKNICSHKNEADFSHRQEYFFVCLTLFSRSISDSRSSMSATAHQYAAKSINRIQRLQQDTEKLLEQAEFAKGEQKVGTCPLNVMLKLVNGTHIFIDVLSRRWYDFGCVQ